MIGTSVAHYKIRSKLGEGGMGEVYQASDTKLNREVALKILPEQFAADSQRMGRFQREAEVLASLSHSNIGHIYGIEDAGNTKALVLELIEGPTLADRIAQGPIPLDEALQLALEISSGLEAAHEKGIVHRDLKPANIKLTEEGQVKILDFGLAKAMEPDPTSSPDMTQSPTLSMAATQAGIILGTAAYMSPEQAKGKPADRRADLWAFGVVLFEMLTGGQAFQGEDVSEVMAAVIMKPPALEKLPDTCPAAIRDLLERCLRRDLKMRLPDIGVARIAIQEYLADSQETAEGQGMVSESDPPVSGAAWLPWSVAGILAFSLLLSFVLQPAPGVPTVRKFRIPHDGARVARISPDGRHVVYRKDNALWIHALDQLNARALDGTEGVTPNQAGFFWSPDSRFLAFVKDNKLWKISVAGESSTVVCDLPAGFFSGGSWGPDDQIAISMGGTGILQVAASGGDALEVMPPAESQLIDDLHHLPDGSGILFTVRGRPVVEVFDGRERRVLFERPGAGISDPIYSPTGHLLFRRDESNEGIWAVPFSLSSLEVTGEDFLVASETGTPSLSADGTLVYSPLAVSGGLRQLVWVDAKGDVGDTIGQPQPNLFGPQLSVTGTHVAVVSDESGQPDVWVHELRRGTKLRVTFSEGNHRPVSWYPSSDRVIYVHNTGGSVVLESKASDASGEADVLVEDATSGVLTPDSKFLIYESTNRDIYYVEIGGGQPQAIIAADSQERHPAISPDGEYVAYVSTASGNREIFVKRFPPSEGVWQGSVRGGDRPRWSRDGARLHFLQDGILMSVEVDTSGASPVFGNPAPLFSFRDLQLANGYDVAADGRIVATRAVSAATSADDMPPSFVIIENWIAEFQE